jgi:ribosome maturation factor RimP
MHSRGQKSPLSYCYIMILTENIVQLVNQLIEGSELFLVEAVVKPGNRISVYIDKLEGVTINECAGLSRAIEEHLNRDVEDYELEVSSPGLSLPFKVKQQYFKNVGRDVEIILKSGEKISAKLLNMNDEEIVISYAKKVKKEGKSKPELVTEQMAISYNDIKSTKVLINF